VTDDAGNPANADAPGHPHLAELRNRVLAGGAPKYHEANAEKGKLFARDRIRLLVDDGSFVEDGLYANALAGDLPADGVVTGTAAVDGRPVCVMANDSTVKAGSWGARTVEKIVRIIETAYRTSVPMVWLVDSAGARITDQVEMFPGARERVGPAGLRVVRPFRRGRRLHPGVL
jgi:methylmalonyl-CoA decarboxylase subunit alpha